MISGADGPQPLYADDALTALARSMSINIWSDLIEYVKNLPYGRNKNRTDLSLVLTEGKGTCSSKHALLKRLADLNRIHQVRLILGMYKMNHVNTPGIQTTITKNGLEYIPEAHCYLKINNIRIDLTSARADIDRLLPDLLEETDITPEQVNAFKVAFHQDYLRKWIAGNDIALSFEQVWAIREACIRKLEG